MEILILYFYVIIIGVAIMQQANNTKGAKRNNKLCCPFGVQNRFFDYWKMPLSGNCTTIELYLFMFYLKLY